MKLHTCTHNPSAHLCAHLFLHCASNTKEQGKRTRVWPPRCSDCTSKLISVFCPLPSCRISLEFWVSVILPSLPFFIRVVVWLVSICCRLGISEVKTKGWYYHRTFRKSSNHAIKLRKQLAFKIILIARFCDPWPFRLSNSFDIFLKGISKIIFNFTLLLYCQKKTIVSSHYLKFLKLNF